MNPVTGGASRGGTARPAARRIGIVAALAGMAGLAIVALSWSGATDELGTAVESGEDTQAALEPPSFADARDSDPALDRESTQPHVSGVEPASRVAARTTPGWWLVGKVHGLDGLDPGSARITVMRFRSFAHVDDQEVAADGTYEVDVTLLFEQPGGTEIRIGDSMVSLPTWGASRALPPEDPATLQIQVHHEFCLGGDETFQPAQAGRARGKDERIEIHRDVTCRAGAVVFGRVSVPSPKRAQDAEVVLIRDVAFDRFVASHAATTHPDPDGRFQLVFDGEGHVVLFAFHDGFPVGVGSAVAKIGARVDAGTIALERRGAQLSGTVRLPAGIAVGDCEVTARRDGWVEHTTPTTFRGIVRNGDRFVDTIHTTRTGPDGRFEFEALDPGLWGLHLDSVPGIRRADAHDPIFATVPATGVVLGENTHRIAVVVTNGGARRADAPVMVSSGIGEVGLVTDEEGRAVWLGSAGMDYPVTVALPGFEPVSIVISMRDRPRDHEVTIDVAVPSSAARLDLLAPRNSTAAAKKPSVKLTLTPPDPGASAVIERGANFADGGEDGGNAGRWTFDGLPVGRFRARVEPADPSGLPAAYFGPILATEEFDVTLVAGATVEHVLTLEPVGRLRIEFTGFVPGDQNRFATVEVIGEGGVRAGRSVVIYRESRFLRVEDTVGLDSANVVEPDLPPGEYEVRIVHSKYRAAPQKVTVVAGETVIATIVLD